MKNIILILLFPILLSGCVGEKVDHNATTGELPISVETLVDLAKKDLAEKSKTPIADIQVAGVTPVEWTDTSLGYPEPDTVYAPVTTRGYVIMLMVEGKLYEYHSDHIRIVPPQGYLKEPEVIQTANITEESSKVVDLAKKDLAGRLKIPEANIQVSEIISTDWPDTSLGYPERGMMYAQVISPGFEIILSVDNKTYEYHSDYERIVLPTVSK